jgi:hypothetical protein
MKVDAKPEQKKLSISIRKLDRLETTMVIRDGNAN